MNRLPGKASCDAKKGIGEGIKSFNENSCTPSEQGTTPSYPEQGAQRPIAKGETLKYRGGKNYGG